MCFYMVVIEGNDPSFEAYETPAYPSMLYHRNEFVSRSVPHIATIFPCNKAGRVKIRHYSYSSNASIFVLGYCAPRCLPTLWLAGYSNR